MIAYDILKKVHHKYDGDTDYPEFAEDDMQLYFSYLKDSIEEWMDLFPEKREQYAELSEAEDGDITTTPGEKTIDAPSDFVRPVTFIYVGGRKYYYLAPQQMEVEKSLNSLKRWFTFIGSPGEIKIVLNPIPETSEPVNYPYWKTIPMPTEENSEVKVSRPNFCVYYILRQLYLDDEANKDLVGFYERRMQEEEYRERVAIAKTVFGSPNRMTDLSVRMKGAAFGQLSSETED